MTTPARRTLAAFAVCQGLGALGFVFWASANSPAPLVSSWVLLFPGNLIASHVTTATLWNSGFSLGVLSWFSLLLAIALNAGLWAGTYRAIRPVPSGRIAVSRR